MWPYLNGTPFSEDKLLSYYLISALDKPFKHVMDEHSSLLDKASSTNKLSFVATIPEDKSTNTFFTECLAYHSKLVRSAMPNTYYRKRYFNKKLKT